MSKQLAAALTAIAALNLFIALGLFVADFGEPARWVKIEHAVVGHGALLAWWATWLGYPQILVPVCLALLVVAWRVPAWRERIFFSIAALVVCWLAATVSQEVFGRPRRPDWVVKHETAFSFPSSHAAIAAGFYLLWAVFLWRSRVEYARVLAAICATLALVICWARLALGAHYVTDVAGGVLLAVALVAAGAAVLPINVFGEPAGRT
ncbi:MAG: phosphatase PAP2 family protein [Vulcanimicrobiaceae bacterium]